MISAEQKEKIQRQLPSGLDKISGYLFNLADILVENAQERQWDALVCDDTSGRLPMYFLRKVLVKKGVLKKPNVLFVNASKTMRAKFSEEEVGEHIKDTLTTLGTTANSLLVITESSDSGSTLRFLRNSAGIYTPSVDTAAVVVRSDRQHEADFVGGSGILASLRVSDCLEREPAADLGSDIIRFARKAFLPHELRKHLPTSLRTLGNMGDASFITGLKSDVNADKPISTLSDAGALPLSYSLVDELINKYNNTRP